MGCHEDACIENLIGRTHLSTEFKRVTKRSSHNQLLCCHQELDYPVRLSLKFNNFH